MFYKHDFIESNQEIIDKEVKEVIEAITERLKKNGYYKGDFNFDTPSGVVIAVAGEVKYEIEGWGWNVTVDVQASQQNIKFEIQ
ncbi:hypothetical protein AYJ58_13140 [Shewanella sp. Pdp11]|uniref:hypothetical protein n=1 Tax=Shewanella sp. Pdp11 TaxID=2059264 RepID=UPI000CA0D145|nr:hypothetical protein [Shewanella sp. Pdp11]AUD60370.1 hypothetical protein AYJ58_13140 [Shewanella sp. Pdp11]